MRIVRQGRKAREGTGEDHRAAAGRSHPDIPTKSGVMVGLGETREELSQTMADLRAAGVDLLTVGQYLRPTRVHMQMDRFYHPSEFREIEEEALALGFAHVASGPLVRSSYRADEQHASATRTAVAV